MADTILRKMNSYARWLFGIAAGFNFAVAAGLLLLRPWLSPALRLDPGAGPNVVAANASGVMIATFGYAYARVAIDPGRYRPYISLGAIAKSFVVVGTLWPWLEGAIDWHLPALAVADVIFTLLFLDFLRRT